MKLNEGQIIEAPFISGLAEVKKFLYKKGLVLLEVILKDSNQYKKIWITEKQLSEIEIVDTSHITPSESSEDFFFFIEANRIRLAYQFDPLLAVNVSQVDPLPHQIEAVYHYVLKSPKIRFLIADDAGAGKTIMAGLILKELQYRNLVQRILIVAPSHLKDQWRRELKEKFNLKFKIIDRSVMNALWGENVWEEENHCITSIDFLKRDELKQSITGVPWDLVIVDEAHKLAAYKYHTKEGFKIEKTDRYKVGEILSKYATHLLFLTATPHKGDEENFRLFLDLLKPGFFSKTELLKESVENKENPIFVRRLKEDMKDFKGNNLFPPRNVKTIKFRLTEEEKELYNAVTDYVRNYFDKAREKRSIAFAMMILQRRLTSSVYSILSSLERRKKRLEELLELPDKIKENEEYNKIKNLTEDDLEDLEEKERWKIEKKLEYLTIAKNIEDVKIEINQVEKLIEKANKVKTLEIESKLVKLRDELLTSLGDKKLLIFTEFKDTLFYLERKLKEWGYKVNVIHGDMNLDARIKAEYEFKHNTQIMVATEAAGEGINLQFCSLMVNYDIPWNPNRLDQRMGRIHRYLQNKEVFIWNMISIDTIEGQVLDKVFDKLDKMKNSLGSDKVFDIIGELIPDTRLDELLKDAIFSQRRMDEIFQKVEEIDEKTIKEKLEKVFLTSLATHHIDYTGLLKESLQAQENRLVPEYIEDYFLKAFKKFKGKIEKKGKYYAIDSVPYELRKLNKDYGFKNRFGEIHPSYANITFYKELASSPEAEFIAPGHTLLEAVNEKILKDFSKPWDQFSVFGDPTNKKEGVLWFVIGEVTDGLGQIAGKKVFCIYQDIKGSINSDATLNSSILWDLKPLDNYKPAKDLKNLIADKEYIQDYIISEILFPYREEVEKRKIKECKIKEKYGLRSLEYLIQESNDKLLQYQYRQNKGEKMDMPILNETRNKEDLERKKEVLKKEIELEKNLTVSEPKILGVSVVIPMEKIEEKEKDAIMHTDPEVEKIGMQVAMEFEKAKGWSVEEVSEENLGFDLRSIKYDSEGTFKDIRYIEVKARAQSGAIRLSSNEWKKAKRFQDKYWLYIIINARSKPELKRIQNPADKFKIDEDIYSTGYIIPKEKWEEKV